jgi:hypothetical protein
MVQDDIGSASPEPQPTAKPRQRVRTEIEFPYADLPAAVDLVQRIHSHAGTACDDQEIAAWLDMSVNGGTFRARRSSAGMFGLIEASGRRLTLTQLGIRVTDDSDRGARGEAFLKPELFAKMYDQWRGQALPPPAAIERQMGELGVPPKQKTRARQVFQKSAQYAGFIDASSGRFVKPTGNGIERQPAPSEKTKEGTGRSGDGGGDGDDPPPRHPLVEGMFQSLPLNGQSWTLDEAADWLHAAAYNLRFAYKLKGKITVDIKVERQGETN